MRLLKKVYHLIIKKEYSIILLQKELEKLYNSFNFQNLIYHFKGPTKDIDFNNFIDAEILFDDLKSLEIRFEDVDKNQIEIKWCKNRGKQLSETENIIKFHISREDVVKVFNDYFKAVNKAAYDAKHGKGLKISTPKQILQRLPISFAQV